MPDTHARWIIGTLLVVGGVLFSQNNSIQARIDDLRDHVGRLERRVEGMDTRLRNVETTFGEGGAADLYSGAAVRAGRRAAGVVPASAPNPARLTPARSG